MLSTGANANDDWIWNWDEERCKDAYYECEGNDVCLASVPDCQLYAQSVTLYSGANYTGESKTISFYDYQTSEGDLSGLNDKVSSIKLPSGYRIRMYEQYSKGGRSLILDRSTPDLSSLDFNDLSSSYLIEPDRSTPPGDGQRFYAMWEDGLCLAGYPHSGYGTYRAACGSNKTEWIRIQKHDHVELIKDGNKTSHALDHGNGMAQTWKYLLGNKNQEFDILSNGIKQKRTRNFKSN